MVYTLYMPKSSNLIDSGEFSSSMEYNKNFDINIVSNSVNNALAFIEYFSDQFVVEFRNNPAEKRLRF